MLVVAIVATALPVLRGEGEAEAAPAVWSATGPGEVDVTSDGGTSSPSFTYNLDLGTSRGVPLSSWTFQAEATEVATVTVPWVWDGFHAFFQVTVGLDAFVTRVDVTTGVDVTTRVDLIDAGPINCCTTPSAGFVYTGSHTFDLQPGDRYGFVLSGSNFDSTSVLRGTFTLNDAPFVANEAVADNTSWSRALLLEGTVQGRLLQPGESRWYKFPITPDSQVAVTLANLAQNFDLAIYRDITQAFDELTTDEDLALLGAQFAADAYAPSIYSPSIYSPSIYSPSIYSPSIYSPSIYSPSIYSPSIYSPSIYSPSIYSPSIYSPSIYSPSIYSPSIYSPSIYSPEGSSLSDQAFADAFTGAQTRSLIAVSGLEGTSSETIRTATWNNTGDFYVRVSGRNGAFSPEFFSLTLEREGGPCDAIPIRTFASTPSITGLPAGRRTLILTDSTRFGGPLDPAFVAKLDELATATDGVVIDVAASPRVVELRQQAEATTSCTYLKNLLAEAIRDIVVDYRAANASVEYVVLVGGDRVIPFFRYPDGSGLGPESDYLPPLLDGTASNAALRSNSVLGQDAYGTAIDIDLRGSELPVPDLPVGRLVESPSQITTMIDAYLTSPVLRPASSFVSGYDFLTSAADVVEEDFDASVGAEATDTLVTNQGVPTDLVTEGTPSRDRSWTADDLRNALTAERYDVYFLAGHFNANSTLAADYETNVVAREFVGTQTFRNSLVISPGCHSGFNIQDGDAVPLLTEPLDWPQLMAQQGATLLAGTGYQYADTDFLAYSAELYTMVTERLRVGQVGTPVSVGEALMDAKRTYLEEHQRLSGIDKKSIIQATLYGLPMAGVDFQSGRIPDVPASGGVTPIDVVTPTPGNVLDLKYADYTITPDLTPAGKPIQDLDGTPTGDEFSWLVGDDGVETTPAVPALPKQIDDVTSTTGEVLRGVGFVSGTYSDTTGVRPLTGAPATEQNGIHTDFTSPVFWPQRLVAPNQFGRIAGSSSDGRTRLITTPAQYRAEGTGTTNTERRYQSLGLRLFYSSNIQTYGDRVPALAAPPSISEVSSQVGAPDGNGTVGVFVSARITGDPAAGIDAVWVTYTAESGPLHGEWQSAFLQISNQDSTLWGGGFTLPAGQDPAQVRFMVQAVNGVGLVGLDNNVGALYTPAVPVGAPVAPTATPTSVSISSATATTAPIGSTVTVSATLTGPGAGRQLVFSLGSASRTAVTDNSGVATAILPASGPVGPTQLSVSFPGDADFAPSGANAVVDVQRVDTSTSLTSTGTVKVSGGIASGVNAVLTRAGGAPIGQQSVQFRVVDAGGATVAQRVVATDPDGLARLGTLSIANGTYTVEATFAGTSSTFAPSSATPVPLVVAVSGPSVVGTPDPAPNANGWNNGNVTVTWTCEDVTGTPVCPSPTTVTTDGVTDVNGSATDRLGNTTTSTVTVRRDTVPPLLSGAPTTAPNVNGWYNGNVTIAWTCSDAMSGIDGTCPLDTVITGDGAALDAGQTVSDRAGNATSALSSPSVRIDRVAPVTTAGDVPAASATGVTITLSPEDGLSGVASTRYRIDNGPEQTGTTVNVSGAGVRTVQYWSIDRAGNVEATRSLQVVIDASAPGITWALTPLPNADGWNRTDVLVSFTCTPRGSATIAACTPPVTVTTEGRAQPVVGTAVTTAGVRTSETAFVSIDRTAPTITVRRSREPNAAGWYRTPVVVQFRCSDALSGVRSCSDEVIVRNEGVVDVPGSSTDAAGNTANVVVPIRVDRTNPDVVIEGIGQRVYDVAALPTPSCRTTDTRSGVAVPATLSQRTFGPVVVVWCSGAVDVAGNRAPVEIATYRVRDVCDGLAQLVRELIGTTSPQRVEVVTRLVRLLRDGRIDRFVTQVRSEVGRTLTQAQADRLVFLAGLLDDDD